MKSGEWYIGIATHMWRSYFNIRRKQETYLVSVSMTGAALRKYSLCDEVLKQFPPSDQEMIESCFSSCREYIPSAVENYSLKNNVPVTVIWAVLHKASKAIMVKLGLMDEEDA